MPYSVTIRVREGHWVTSWYEYDNPDEIDWEKVETHCRKYRHRAYGYVRGAIHSRNISSPRNRTVIKVLIEDEAIRRLLEEQLGVSDPRRGKHPVTGLPSVRLCDRHRALIDPHSRRDDITVTPVVFGCNACEACEIERKKE